MKKLKRNYSATELHLLALLPNQNGARVSTSQLMRMHYGNKAPRFGRQTVTWMLRSLGEKIKENQENFRLCSTKRRGPHETEHWLQ